MIIRNFESDLAPTVKQAGVKKVYPNNSFLTVVFKRDGSARFNQRSVPRDADHDVIVARDMLKYEKIIAWRRFNIHECRRYTSRFEANIDFMAYALCRYAKSNINSGNISLTMFTPEHQAMLSDRFALYNSIYCRESAAA